MSDRLDIIDALRDPALFGSLTDAANRKNSGTGETKPLPKSRGL